MRRLTRMQSRSGALTVLVAAASLIVWLIFSPLIGQYRSMNAAIDDAQFQIFRYQRLAANHDLLRNHLSRLKQGNRTKNYYVTGESAALASANMQQHLKRTLDDVGGELISTQLVVLNGSDNESATSLRVHMKADISTLLQVLYGLENDQPMFFLDDFAINARPLRSGAQPRPTEVILDVRFNLTGFRQEAV